jgi:hypothetical protein
MTIPISNAYQMFQVYLPFDLLFQVDLEGLASLWNPMREKEQMLVDLSTPASKRML